MSLIARCEDCGGTGWLGHTTGDGQAASDARRCPTCAGEGEVVPASRYRGAVEALAKIERVYERTMPGPKDALRDQVLEIIARHRAGGQ